MRITRTKIVSGLLLLATVTLGPTRMLGAAQTERPQHHPESHQPAKPAMQGKMTMDCQSMMAEHQKAMEEMKAMDARLDTLVQSMNVATGPAKVDATAAVVTELVSQRRAMRERMGGMQAAMMRHMMEHMQAGGAQSAMECPMMKEMGSMKH